METITGRFEYECETCPFGDEQETLDTAFTDVEMHRRTKMHSVHWTRIEFTPSLGALLGPKWKVECETCYQEWQFDTEPDADAFANQHEEIVGHEPDEVRERDTATLDTESIKSLLRQLTPEFDRGVPRPVLLGVLEPEGYSRKEIDRQVERLSKTGEVYRPTSHRYRYIDER